MNSNASTLFTSLWIGDELPPMSRLCIQSFIDHGQRFQLFCYKQYDNLPLGVILRDARDILPEEEIFRDTTYGSLAPFSDWFRMKFLAEEGGFWVDMDVICLRSDAIPRSDTWFARQNDEEVAVGAMRFPPHHPIPTALAKLAMDPAAAAPWDTPSDTFEKSELRCRVPEACERRRLVPWGFCGPTGFTHALKGMGLYEQAAPPSHIYPIPWTRWRELYNGEASLSSPSFAGAWCVHLWGEMLRHQPDTWRKRAENSVVSELMSRHMRPDASHAAESGQKNAILVGICSCCTASARRAACRDTWLRRIAPGVERRFFLGSSAPIPEEPDVIALSVDDSYDYLPTKGLAFYRHALEHYEFDWLFKCDDDTYLRPDRLIDLCDASYDMIGDMSIAWRGAPSGGAGYLMSRRLVEYIVTQASRIPETGWEDLVFGYLARDAGAKMLATPRLQLDKSPCPLPDNDIVSCHWCSPELMYEIDAKQDKS